MLPSKNQVRNAGKRIAAVNNIFATSDADVEIIDEWRKAHLTPLSSIAMWLRKPSIDATGLAPAQRLKRRSTKNRGQRRFSLRRACPAFRLSEEKGIREHSL